MLVYGDHWREVAPRDLLRVVEAAIAEAGASEANASEANASTGHRRADLLARALIDAGRLAQGIADRVFEATGMDDEDQAQSSALAVATAVAAGLAGAGQGCRPAAPALSRLRALPLPDRVRCKLPEGYAFYAVYPEAYAAAALAHAFASPPLVIGLRSIGTGLAAMVAAATGGRALTLRPCGHPFRRELRLSDRLADSIRSHPGPVAVVDEGPGLSGSSFAATAEALTALGIAEKRVVFIPSHAADPGPAASAPHRALWSRVRRLPVECFATPKAVRSWFADIEGVSGGTDDLSGGAWRRDLPAPMRPPANPQGERLKFRFTGGRRRLLARFAGLGALGEEKLAMAAALADAGFTPEPLALRRGFLLERWIEGAPAAADELRQPGRLARAAAYLGFRARRFPAEPGEGAAAGSLCDMARTNARELGGSDLEAQVSAAVEPLAGMTGLRPVRTDGRLQAWEWKVAPDGRLLKTDALDHWCSHDLVGCQDVAWDVAGAVVEFGLSPDEAESFRAAVEAEAGRGVDPAAVRALLPCYAAFQGGAWSLAAAADPAGGAGQQVNRYLAALRAAAR